jgi:hypothetical protein
MEWCGWSFGHFDQAIQTTSRPTELCAVGNSEDAGEGHCSAHGQMIPYLPLLELLRDIFGIAERDTDHEARRKIASELTLLDDNGEP